MPERDKYIFCIFAYWQNITNRFLCTCSIMGLLQIIMVMFSQKSIKVHKLFAK